MSIYGDLELLYAAGSPLTAAASERNTDAAVAELLQEYLDAIHVGVDLAAEEGWKVVVTLDAEPRSLLLIPAWRPGERLAVRAVDLAYLTEKLDARERGVDVPFDATRVVASSFSARLAVNDVPTPFRRGILDGTVVWVCRDPFHALRLQGLGITATALAHPSRTLGSAESLDQLVRLMALSRRDVPWGTLVILDEGEDILIEESTTLRRVYGAVWEDPLLYRSFYTAVEAAIVKARTSQTTVEEALLAQVREQGRRAHSTLEDEDLGWLGPVDSDRVLDPFPMGWGEQAGRGTREPLELVPMSELSTKAPTIKWLLEDFVAEDTITELQGLPKHGKTTLALPMAAAISRGGTFLGRSCKRAPVVYVSEQTRATLLASLRRAGSEVEDPDALPDLHVLSVERLFGRTWDEILSFLRTQCRELDAGLVVFDTLGQVSMLQGEAEASTGGAARGLFRSLRTFNFDGVAVLAVRHSRKAAGDIIETGLGSVTVSGEADHIVRIRNLDAEPKDVRRIDSVGRLSDPLDVAVELTPKGWVKCEPEGETVDGNSGQALTRAPKKKSGSSVSFVLDVINAAGDDGVTPEAVMLAAKKSGLSGLGEKTVRAALTFLVKEELVRVKKKPRPYHYYKK